MYVIIYYIDQVGCHTPCSEIVNEEMAECNGLPIEDGLLSKFSRNDQVSSPTETRKTCTHTAKDPVHDVCPGLKVKIADLGNACWEVMQ